MTSTPSSEYRLNGFSKFEQLIFIDFIDVTKVSNSDVDKIRRVLPDNFQKRVSGDLILKKTSLLGRALLYLNYIEEGRNHIKKLEFKLKRTGKLHLENEPSFNISHTGNYVVLARSLQSKNIEIGIDVEKKRELRNISEMLTYYTKKEQQVVMDSPNQSNEFLKIWTRKEAFYKAIGTGIYKKNSLKDINSLNDTIHYKEQNWYVKSLSFQEAHWLSCATSEETVLRTRERTLSELERT